MRPRSISSRVIGVVALLFGALSSASSQNAEALKALVGDWELSNADRDRMCALSLKQVPAAAGFKAERNPACAAAIPATGEIESWSVSNDVVRLMDAQGKTVFEFTEVESGIYEAERVGEGLYFLQSLAAAGPAFRTPDQMAGEWSMLNGAKTICALILSADPVAGAPEGSRALRLQEGCDPIVTRFAPAYWHMDRGELVLSSGSGQTWRFAQDGRQQPNWRRVPERVSSMMMVKR